MAGEACSYPQAPLAEQISPRRSFLQHGGSATSRKKSLLGQRRPNSAAGCSGPTRWRRMPLPSRCRRPLRIKAAANRGLAAVCLLPSVLAPASHATAPACLRLSLPLLLVHHLSSRTHFPSCVLFNGHRGYVHPPSFLWL